MRLKTYRNTKKHRQISIQTFIYSHMKDIVNHHILKLDSGVDLDEKNKLVDKIKSNFLRVEMREYMETEIYQLFLNSIILELHPNDFRRIKQYDRGFIMTTWEYDKFKMIESLITLSKSIKSSEHSNWDSFHDRDRRLNRFYEFLVENKDILNLKSIEYQKIKPNEIWDYSFEDFKSTIYSKGTDEFIKNIRKSINRSIRQIKSSFKFGGNNFYNTFKESKNSYVIKHTSEGIGLLMINYDDYDNGLNDEIKLFFHSRYNYFKSEVYKDIFMKMCLELDRINVGLEIKKFFGWYKKLVLIDHYRKQNKTSEGVFRLILKDSIRIKDENLYKWVKYKQLITFDELKNYYDSWDYSDCRKTYYNIIMDQDYINYNFREGQLVDEYWIYIRNNFSRIMDEFKSERDNTSHIYDLNIDKLINEN